MPILTVKNYMYEAIVKISKQALVGKERLKELLESLTDYSCELDEYLNNKHKIGFTHLTCGTTWLVRPNDFSSGKRCPACSMENRKKTLAKVSPKKSYKAVKDYIENETGYTLISTEFENNKVKLDVRHDICGNIYQVRYNDFQQGYRCPHCAFDPRKSTASSQIEDFLKLNGIDFDKEVTFDGLKFKRSLFYDFVIYIDRSANEYFILEYHGKQHFVKTKGSAWFRNAKFEVGLKRDKIKVDFARNHGITLETITYKEDHIEKLKEILSANNVSRL